MGTEVPEIKYISRWVDVQKEDVDMDRGNKK